VILQFIFSYAVYHSATLDECHSDECHSDIKILF